MEKTVSATELARNLSQILDQVEFHGVELSVVRNNHPIARIIPGAPRQTALEAMSDLYRTLPDEAAKDWLKASRSFSDKLNGIRDPWAS